MVDFDKHQEYAHLINQRLHSKDCKFIIAVDGPSASGKSYFSSLLSRILDWDYLPTGKMYRFIAQIHQSSDCKLSESDLISILSNQKWELSKLQDTGLEDENIASVASHIAILPNFRNALEAQQRDIISKNRKSIIVEGRGIATHLIPEAHLKLYISCDEIVRAERRAKALSYIPQTKELSVAQKLSMRDSQDRNRSIAPLSIDPEAIVLNNSSNDIDILLNLTLHHIIAKLSA